MEIAPTPSSGSEPDTPLKVPFEPLFADAAKFTPM
jgi:hypothetical protein